MRLLLLLSAIFAALTGGIGSRASVAQPVTATAPAEAAGQHCVTIARAAVPSPVRSWGRGFQVPLPDILPLRAGPPLYADRLRI